MLYSPKNGLKIVLMSIISDLLAKVEKAQEGLQGSMIREVVSRHETDILEFQKMQLLRGLSSSGEDLRPYYSEDLKPNGYFYSVESAGRYAAWKQDLSYPYEAQRNPDAPNLYINGKFHSELGVEFGPETVKVDGETGYAKGIVAKYGLSNFGLMPEYWNEIFSIGALDELMNELKSVLYG